MDRRCRGVADKTVNGRRVTHGQPYRFDPGDYGRGPFGIWYARPPAQIDGLIANLVKHEVIEHEDGTISVHPSIEVTRRPGERWHGYLERGTWREAK